MSGTALIELTVLLLLLELGTRAFLTVPQTASTVVVENAAYAYHPWSAHRMTPGFEFNHMRINSYGWRGSEYSRMKSGGTRRVILLGDSVAFSSFYLTEKATIAGYLQSALEEATKSPWEVLNMAVPGGTGRKALATLAHEGIHFQPDVIVALNGANDCPPRRIQDASELERPFQKVQWDPIHIRMWRLYDPRTGRGSWVENLRVIMNESALVRK